MWLQGVLGPYSNASRDGLDPTTMPHLMLISLHPCNYSPLSPTLPHVAVEFLEFPQTSILPFHTFRGEASASVSFLS